VTPEARADARAVAVGLVPPATAAVLLLAFLGRRPDYVGHFLAGFGATLGALGLATLPRPPSRVGPATPLRTLALVLLCVAGGAVLEASLFRIARFDPVDFCNQSLGATFAGAAALVAGARGAPSHAVRAAGGAAAVSSTLAGFWFAFS
jgi:hypothetical protein